MNQDRLQKRLLLAFRRRFKSGGSKEDRMSELKRLSGVVLPSRNLSRRRNKFNKVKAQLHKLWTRRNKVCFCCSDPATVRHHIIQLQHGGHNSRKNIVSLCSPCHAEIHPWLAHQNLIRVMTNYDADEPMRIDL